MSTLHTIGCSYTGWHWPTWADFTGKFFSKFNNYGESGAGNTYIFTELVRKIEDGIIRENDTVIVQWSSLLREDRIFTDNTTYTFVGNVKNNLVYDDNFVNTYFNPIQKAYELNTYITSIKALSEKYKFKLLMFFMFPPWVSDFLGEPTSFTLGKHTNGYQFIQNEKIFDNLKKEYEDSKLFIPTSLEEVNLEKKTGKGFIYINRELTLDHHPLPDVHLEYCINYILPRIKVEKTENCENQIYMLQHNVERLTLILKNTKSYQYNKDRGKHPDYGVMLEPEVEDIYNKLLI